MPKRKQPTKPKPAWPATFTNFGQAFAHVVARGKPEHVHVAGVSWKLFPSGRAKMLKNKR